MMFGRFKSGRSSARPVPEYHRVRPTLYGHLCICAGLLVPLVVLPSLSIPAEAAVDALNVALLAVFVWALGSWRWVRGSVFGPYGLFLLATAAFHGSYSILRLFGLERAIYLAPEISEATMAATLLLALVAVGGLHAGALLSLWTVGQPLVQAEAVVAHDDAVAAVGLALLTIALPFTVMEFVTDWLLVQVGGYKELFLAADGSPGAGRALAKLAAGGLVPGAMFYLAGRSQSHTAQIVSFAAVIVFAGCQFALGHRGYAVLPLIAYAWLWHQVVKPLPLRSIVVAGSALAVVTLPVLGRIRALAGPARLSWDTVREALASVGNPVTSLLGEAGGTLLTISYTIDLAAAGRPFGIGAGYLYAVANAIPVVDVVPPGGYASTWLAWAAKPTWAANGHGFGYSYIAEAYLNVGWWGVPVVAAVVGFGIVALLRWVENGEDAARYALLAAFLPALLFFARGELVNIVRPLLWFAVVPFVCSLALRRIMESRNVWVAKP